MLRNAEGYTCASNKRGRHASSPAQHTKRLPTACVTARGGTWRATGARGTHLRCRHRQHLSAPRWRAYGPLGEAKLARRAWRLRLLRLAGRRIWWHIAPGGDGERHYNDGDDAAACKVRKTR